MDKIIDIFLCGGMVAIEIIEIIVIALFIQLVVYQLSNKKINLYKTISFYLLDRYIQK